jgi:ribose transport system substrate-binding protein
MAPSYAIVLASTLLISSCPTLAKECVTLIVSGSESRPYWSEVIKGAIKAGEELELQIYARGTVNDMDARGQQFILNNTMNRYHCRGIVIAPSDSSRNLDVTQYKARGIPSIYIDRDTGGDRLAVIKTNNYAAGQLAAREMAKALGDKKRVLLFRLQKGVQSTDEREEGFINQAEKLGLQIVASRYLGTRVGQARSEAEQLLNNNQNIDGIFTPNDTTTIGILKARENYPSFDNVVHIGFDEQPYIVDSLKQRKLHGYIVQQPYQMGYQGVYTIQRILNGDTPINNIHTAVKYINQSKL